VMTATLSLPSAGTAIHAISWPYCY
jgi:hypothetical protein